VNKEPRAEEASKHTFGICQGTCGGRGVVVRASEKENKKKGTKKRRSRERAPPPDRKLLRM